MSGIVANPQGITYPPIDELLERAPSKYALVILSAKRARQINAYRTQLESNMVRFVGPVIPFEADDKPLSISLEELVKDKLDLEADQVD